MDQPEILPFTGQDIKVSSLQLGSPQGPMNRRWVRLQFKIPDTYEAPQKVLEWIKTNIIHNWAYYTFSDPRDSEYQMVIRFQDRNDALMFKLKGGHQIWDV